MNPHAGKTRLKPALEELTRDARERTAKEVFDIEKIRAAMVEAGKGGWVSCLIGPKLHQNLRDTAAAKAATAWLQAEGFSHGWEARPAVDVRPGSDSAYDLLVTWRV